MARSIISMFKTTEPEQKSPTPAKQLTADRIDRCDFPGDNPTSIGDWVQMWPRLLIESKFGVDSPESVLIRQMMAFRGFGKLMATTPKSTQPWAWNEFLRSIPISNRYDALYEIYQVRCKAILLDPVKKRVIGGYVDFWLNEFEHATRVESESRTDEHEGGLEGACTL